MSTVALVVHSRRQQALELAGEVSRWLAERGHGIRVPKEDAEDPELQPYACDVAELADGLDLVVSFGGDGTVLRAVALVAGDGVPVLGVNLGRLGYLTEVEPSAVFDALERWAVGDHTVEERMMLAVTVARSGAAAGDPPDPALWALNEVAVEKPSPGRTVHVAVVIGGRPFQRYVADGIIVATPTGSTAYSFSAHGPIVSPKQRALIITPVSAHSSFDRSLVLHPSDPVRLEVEDRSAILTVDGRDLGKLGAGDTVECSEAPAPACFLRFAPRDFFTILSAKFGLRP